MGFTADKAFKPNPVRMMHYVFDRCLYATLVAFEACIIVQAACLNLCQIVNEIWHLSV